MLLSNRPIQTSSLIVSQEKKQGIENEFKSQNQYFQKSEISKKTVKNQGNQCDIIPAAARESFGNVTSSSANVALSLNSRPWIGNECSPDMTTKLIPSQNDHAETRLAINSFLLKYIHIFYMRTKIN